MCPAIREGIDNLRRLKALRAAIDGDDEIKTINDLDLANAILNGPVVKAEELERSWEVVFHGPDREGDIVIVIVYVDKDPNAPIQISNFTFPQG